MLAHIKTSQRLWKQRNDIIHSPAIASTAYADAAFWAKVTRPGRAKPERNVALTVRYLEEHATKLSEVGDAIWEFASGHL
jgi:hypothetical protein